MLYKKLKVIKTKKLERKLTKTPRVMGSNPGNQVGGKESLSDLFQNISNRTGHSTLFLKIARTSPLGGWALSTLCPTSLHHPVLNSHIHNTFVCLVGWFLNVLVNN